MAHRTSPALRDIHGIPPIATEDGRTALILDMYRMFVGLGGRESEIVARIASLANIAGIELSTSMAIQTEGYSDRIALNQEIAQARIRDIIAQHREQCLAQIAEAERNHRENITGILSGTDNNTQIA